MAAQQTLDAILVVGPSGAIGKALCQALIARKAEFKRIAFFNDTSRPETDEKQSLFATFRNGGMEQVSGKYTDTAAFTGFDCVLMPLGNHAIKYQPTIIDSAITAGVRHFYTSEWGADLSVGSNWTQRYYRDKVLTREHLEKRGRDTDTPDLGWTYIQLGRLTEWSIIKHFGVDNANHVAEIYGTPEGKQSLLSTPDAIAYTLETLRHPFSTTDSGHRRTYRFHGSSPTWEEIFNELETITGHKYAVTYRDVETAVEKEARAKRLGDVDLELEASHQLIQGRGGTLLSGPFDNGLFPNIHPESVHSVFERIFKDSETRKFLGVS
ncbi:hypothetical protein TARUN_4967 [Trichoderma arundinaceum]|uniref:NmrA-like domain-containing protein n=1 Tax=Trichoderma arundinaceum TaxID=490622 RepID=A0A395NMW6_TRIAR|nr:hypothetical protein TARUN_4967 [Trichoderma arundinaceum]